MDKIIRIGTRSSELALWQANTVGKQLDDLGYKSEIVKIDSIGDVILDKPLYELGVTGVFTKRSGIGLGALEFPFISSCAIKNRSG